jgi:alanine racemase
METNQTNLLASYALGYKDGWNKGVIAGVAVTVAVLAVKRVVTVKVGFRKNKNEK